MSFLKNIFSRLSGKESDMPEDNGNQQTATPPATSGGITLEQLQSTVTAAVKPLQDKISELEKVKPTASATPAAGLNTDDLNRILDERDAKKTASASVNAAKAKVIKEKLNGVDDLASLLPNTDNEAELAAAADALAKKINLSTARKDVTGGGNDGGATAGKQPVDKSKIAPVDRIGLGLK